jgi:hypothetical protein
VDEVGYAFGVGEAIIDLEILFGRNSGKKKKGIRTTINFQESWNYEKRMYNAKGAF